jgi:hypothetical protein
VLTWREFAAARPDLAAAGRELICYHGVGLAFLATVRPDGGPRMHPICPIVTANGLYGYIIPSPKLNDVKRDGRYALHSYPLPDNEDVFYCTGRAKVHSDPTVRRAVAEAFIAQPGLEPPLAVSHFEGQTLVEFFIESCLVTRTTGHGDPNAQHTIWKA